MRVNRGPRIASRPAVGVLRYACFCNMTDWNAAVSSGDAKALVDLILASTASPAQALELFRRCVPLCEAKLNGASPQHQASYNIGKNTDNTPFPYPCFILRCRGCGNVWSAYILSSRCDTRNLSHEGPCIHCHTIILPCEVFDTINPLSRDSSTLHTVL